MQIIKDISAGGERPFYKSNHLTLEGVRVTEGESALKECTDIRCVKCLFEGKYPLWEVRGFEVRDCRFSAEARSALWYSENLKMKDTVIDAPKMFREMKNLELTNVQINDADEAFWHCEGIRIKDVTMNGGTYPFMSCKNIFVDGLETDSKYVFQYVSNAEIHHARITTKDALWEAKNVTVYDSYVNSEYLAWYSDNVKFVRCHIGGEQVLCYAKNLVLEDCTFDENAGLAFEYSDVRADIRGSVRSVKNPSSGLIVADSIGEVILDENIKQPANCKIEIRKAKDSAFGA